MCINLIALYGEIKSGVKYTYGFLHFSGSSELLKRLTPSEENLDPLLDPKWTKGEPFKKLKDPDPHSECLWT